MSQHQVGLFSKKVSYEWKIENFLNQSRKLQSPKFLLSGVHFFFEIYPDGNLKETAGHVSLFLHKESSRIGSHFGYTMGLKSVNGSILAYHHLTHLFTPKDEGFGSSKFVERSKLIGEENVFGPGGTLTVFCEVLEPYILAVETETQTSVDHFQTLSKDFEKFYLSGCHSDIVLDVRGKKFSANRFVLSSRSSVFRSMFQGDMNKSETGDVNITDCDPEAFGAFLLFLYSGKKDVVTSDNAFGLYATADKFNIKDLKDECCERLSREVSVDSVCDVLRLATLHEEKKLLEIATRYFMKNARTILRTPQWQTLSKDNITLVNELFIKLADTSTYLFPEPVP